jgi:hypothetical protein
MEIDIYSKLQNPIEAIEKMGSFFARCGMFRCSRIEQGQMLALICVVEKKSPTQIMREYHIMDDGTLAPRARNIHAKFLEAGGDIDWELTGDEQTDFEKIVARAVFRFKDKKPRTLSFSIADARRMQLPVDKPSSGWRKTPARMCRARLITMAVDLFCPAIAMGGDEIDELPGAAVEKSIDLKSVTGTSESSTKVLTPVVEDSAPESEAKNSEPEAKTVNVETMRESTQTAAQAPVDVPPSTGSLSRELLDGVERVIGTNGLAALAYLRRNGHLREGQGLDCLTEKMATRITKFPDKFVAAILAPVKERSEA